MPLQHSESPTELEIPISKNVQVQTEINGSKFDSLTNEVAKLECTVENQRFVSTLNSQVLLLLWHATIS